MKQAVVYTRFSPRPNATDCDSCEKQEERCVTYCDKNGYLVVWVFHDKDVSGGVLARAGLIGAMNRLTPGSILVVDSPDRLARDLLVSLTIRHQVTERGATIEYADGSPIATTPEGKLLQNVLAAFSAYERDRVRFRTSRGLKKRQENGEWFGKPPIGMMRDPLDSKRLVRCEGEQTAIAFMRKMEGDGCTPAGIACLLNAACDITSCRGRKWHARTIQRVLKREEK